LTQTCSVPPDPTNDAGTVTWSWVEFKNVVERPKLPGQIATASWDVKPAPFTVSVKAALPVGTLAGEMLARLRSAGIVKVTGAEGAPPGFVAVITTGPGIRRRLTGTFTLRKPNPHSIWPRVIARLGSAPLHESTAPGWKPEPARNNTPLAKNPLSPQTP
jgi:hypothetical protein